MRRNGAKQRATFLAGITCIAMNASVASATVFEFDESGNATTIPAMNYIQRERLMRAASASILPALQTSAVRSDPVTEVRETIGHTEQIASEERVGSTNAAVATFPVEAITFIAAKPPAKSMAIPDARRPVSFQTRASRWPTAARDAANAHGVPAKLFLALIEAESSFDPNARSPKGAIGLTQLMPATAAALGVDPHDPHENLKGGARYLRQQFDRFDSWPLALAAYNAGPTRVARLGRIPRIVETQRFVTRVMKQSGLAISPITIANR